MGFANLKLNFLKGQCHEIFNSLFFIKQSSPHPPAEQYWKKVIRIRKTGEKQVVDRVASRVE
jgi:hypothetical protein